MQSLLYGLFGESPWNSESVQIPYKIINDSLWAKLTCFPYNNIYIICYHYSAYMSSGGMALVANCRAGGTFAFSAIRLKFAFSKMSYCTFKNMYLKWFSKLSWSSLALSPSYLIQLETWSESEEIQSCEKMWCLSDPRHDQQLQLLK